MHTFTLKKIAHPIMFVHKNHTKWNHKFFGKANKVLSRSRNIALYPLHVTSFSLILFTHEHQVYTKNALIAIWKRAKYQFTRQPTSSPNYKRTKKDK